MRNVIRDPEFWFIILFNLSIILFYYLNQVDPRFVILVFYIQSIIIGLMNFVRIYSLSNFSTQNFTSNGHSVEPTKSTAVSTAFFFLLHYGGFHLVYFIFLIVMMGTLSDKAVPFDVNLFLISIFFYFVNSLFALVYNIKKDKVDKPNIGGLMFLPYLRIIPMHLFIILGMTMVVGEKTFLGIDALEFFIILKTISDLLMHIISEKTWHPHNRRLPWEIIR